MRHIYARTGLFTAFLCGALLPSAVKAQAPETKVIPVTIRDFNASHINFEAPGIPCYGGEGMVLPDLDKNRKPITNPKHYCYTEYPATFDLKKWFLDEPGVNTRYCQSLTLAKKPASVATYEISNTSFFPIDGVPTDEHNPAFVGDDGKPHNFHFCMEMHASFKYRGGEVFNFLGDDDV